MIKIINNYVDRYTPKKMMTLIEYYADCDRKRNEIYDDYFNKTKQNATKTRSWKTLSKRLPPKIRKWETVPKTNKTPPKIRGWETVPKTNKTLSNDNVGKVNKKFINTTLILKNLPLNCTLSHELLKLFKNCGPIKFIKILKDKDGNCKGLAFIRFETREGSDMGLDMDGFWYGEQKIFVEYAHDHRE